MSEDPEIGSEPETIEGDQPSHRSGGAGRSVPNSSDRHPASTAPPLNSTFRGGEVNDSGISVDAVGWVAIAGDWHGSISWVQSAIPRLHRQAPDVSMIFHLGDFGIFKEAHGSGFLAAVDFLCYSAGISRVFVTPGNHEDWGELAARFAREPGEAVQLSRVVWVLPRGFRFTLGGHRWMSFGGAASVDREFRSEGVDWWADEAPTELDVERAIAGGPVEVMLTHETVDDGTSQVENILATNPMGWAPKALAYSAESRAKVTRVWNAVRPKVLAHGHLHVKGDIELADGRRVYSLGCNGMPGNLALLNTKTLEWEWLKD